MVRRKPILLLDKSDDSIKAIDLFKKLGIDYVEYDIKKFEEGCCGESPTTKVLPQFLQLKESLKV